MWTEITEGFRQRFRLRIQQSQLKFDRCRSGGSECQIHEVPRLGSLDKLFVHFATNRLNLHLYFVSLIFTRVFMVAVLVAVGFVRSKSDLKPDA